MQGVMQNCALKEVTWWFPKIGVPLNHQFLDGIFPYKRSSYGGTPIYRTPHLFHGSVVSTTHPFTEFDSGWAPMEPGIFLHS